jgi:hypothetical protein
MRQLGLVIVGVIACTPGEAGDATAAADGDMSSSTTASMEMPRATPVDLVWPEAWVADPLADAMPTHAPDPVDCTLGFANELGIFEVDTGLCNYGVFSQPLADRIIAGERVDFVFTHDDLVAPEPALGHIAVAIENRVIWEIDVEIPKPYDIVQGEWIADTSIDAGTKVVLHLHNHGYNSWRVIQFESGAPD